MKRESSSEREYEHRNGFSGIMPWDWMVGIFFGGGGFAARSAAVKR